MAQVLESRLILDDGADIFIRDWLNDDHSTVNSKRSIVILHGLGEHCGRYLHVAEFLNSCGFFVRTFDQRGHGQSSGARADVADSLTLINDATVLIRDFSQRFHTVPLLFGHSMGGLFAARIATASLIPLRGLILSSPALALRLSKLDRLMLKLMTAIAPHLAISNNVSSSHLSHDPMVNAAYDSDPLVHKKITASLLKGMLATIDFVQGHASSLPIPVLLLVAENDRLVDPQGSHDFFNAVPKNYRAGHFYPDFYHELFNEVDASKVFIDLKNWLSEQNFVEQ